MPGGFLRHPSCVRKSSLHTVPPQHVEYIKHTFGTCTTPSRSTPCAPRTLSLSTMSYLPRSLYNAIIGGWYTATIISIIQVTSCSDLYTRPFHCCYNQGPCLHTSSPSHFRPCNFTERIWKELINK